MLNEIDFIDWICNWFQSNEYYIENIILFNILTEFLFQLQLRFIYCYNLCLSLNSIRRQLLSTNSGFVSLIELLEWVTTSESFSHCFVSQSNAQMFATFSVN